MRLLFKTSLIILIVQLIIASPFAARETAVYVSPDGSDDASGKSARRAFAAVNRTFTMDWNVFYNPTQPLSDVKFNGMSIEEWRKQGKNRNSIYADPMCVNVDNNDFRLIENSPAFWLGFKPIDVESIGPRTMPGVKDK